MYYYHRIRETREDKDIKQGEIAKYLGITQTQYSRYERGANEIPVHYLIEVANYLNESIDYLVGRTDKHEYQGNENS